MAREGDAAPGTAPGTVFTGSPILFANDHQQFVLYFDLTGTGVTNSNDSGLWCDVGDGQLQLLLREGDSMLVNGVSKTVSIIEFTVDMPQEFDDRFTTLANS